MGIFSAIRNGVSNAVETAATQQQQQQGQWVWDQSSGQWVWVTAQGQVVHQQQAQAQPQAQAQAQAQAPIQAQAQPHAQAQGYGQAAAGAVAQGMGQVAAAVVPQPDDDDDDDDDDDFVRDYVLEGVDDFTTFDLQNDLKGWYVAERKIEAGWEDTNKRRELLALHRIRNEAHFYQLRATVERYIQSPDAAQRYGGIDAIMQLRVNATMDDAMAQMQQRAQGELSGELAPFEGVALEQWAHAQAKVAGGGNVDQIIAEMGIDRAKWDRVSAEWNARMSRDTTCTIATAYGQAFAGAGQGQYGGAAQAGAAAMSPGGSVGTEAEAPIPFERYVEIEVAQSCGAEQGRDAAMVLQQFGMTALDWSSVGGWWSQYMSRNLMLNNQELLHRYNRLQEHYQAHYGAKTDGDVQF